jgi:uracil-DNA glycosylase
MRYACAQKKRVPKPMSYCPFTLEPSWVEALGEELYQPYIAQLAAAVERERYGTIPVYPPKELTFNAFSKTPFHAVKVLLLGQDPYHGPGQAHGLCFSVPPDVPQPPSLQNIFKELQSDLGIALPSHGCLTHWAGQGVLLLNALLSVRQGEPLSHQGKGWERFTDAVVRTLNQKKESMIYVLWGKSAQEKCRFLNISDRHVVLTAPHPSPFSVHSGFFGCRHFSKVNQILHSQGKTPVDWRLDSDKSDRA